MYLYKCGFIRTCTDGTRGFYKDQLKATFAGESCFPLSWSLENPLVPSFWSQLRIAVFRTCTVERTTIVIIDDASSLHVSTE